MNIYIPYSPRSFGGISADATREFPTAKITALVLSGDMPPEGVDCLLVEPDGSIDYPWPPEGSVVVANGGTTQQAVAAVTLAMYRGLKLVNIQRDGVTRMRVRSMLCSCGERLTEVCSHECSCNSAW